MSAELLAALRRELSNDYQVNDLPAAWDVVRLLAQERELNRQVGDQGPAAPAMSGGDFAERFEAEGKISASLDHPNIVPIFRVGASSTFLWYTMKRIRGRSARAGSSTSRWPAAPPGPECRAAGGERADLRAPPGASCTAT